MRVPWPSAAPGEAVEADPVAGREICSGNGACALVARERLCFDGCGPMRFRIWTGPVADRRETSPSVLLMKVEERAALPSARRARAASPGGREGEAGCSVTLL